MILVNLEGSCWSVGRDYPTLDSYVFFCWIRFGDFGGDGFSPDFEKVRQVGAKNRILNISTGGWLVPTQGFLLSFCKKGF